MTSQPISWVEISKQNLLHNVKMLRQLSGAERTYCVPVKANAYGHGLVQAGRILVEAGVDWLGVNALFEAEELRAAGVQIPIYVMGYIPLAELEKAVNMGVHFVVYNEECLLALGTITAKLGKPALTHLKLETGNYRQGVLGENLAEILKIYKAYDGLELEGVATHFANIEDTTDHSYARKQIETFEAMVAEIEKAGFQPNYKHCANSAATILFPKTHFNFVRSGIATYGLWPSEETKKVAEQEGKTIELKPVLTWKTQVAQVKKVPQGAYVGYGCSYKTKRDSRLAVLPVGYYDGYDRGLSNKSFVLIHGKQAPVRGRVAMNMTVIDVTDIPEAKLEDEVVLLGSQFGADGASGRVSAEDLAEWAGTINYEITTRINDRLERRVV